MLVCVFSLELATRVLGGRLPPGKFALSLWPDCLQRGRGPPFRRRPGDDAGETVLRPGMAAGFPKGKADGHLLCSM